MLKVCTTSKQCFTWEYFVTSSFEICVDVRKFSETSHWIFHKSAMAVFFASKSFSPNLCTQLSLDDLYFKIQCNITILIQWTIIKKKKWKKWGCIGYEKEKNAYLWIHVSFMMCVSVKIYSLKSQNFIQQRLRLFKEWEQNWCSF